MQNRAQHKMTGEGRYTDNGDIQSKILVREYAKSHFCERKVLDLHAGEGHIYSRCWSDSLEYLGIDKRFARSRGHERGVCWKGDNNILLKKAMNVCDWNIFDIDAYSNPWIMLNKICANTAQEKFAVTATCGITRSLNTGTSNGYIRQVAGFGGMSDVRLAERWYDEIIRWCIQRSITGTPYAVTSAKRIRARHNVKMWYYAVVFEHTLGGRNDR